LQSEIQPAP